MPGSKLTLEVKAGRRKAGEVIYRVRVSPAKYELLLRRLDKARGGGPMKRAG